MRDDIVLNDCRDKMIWGEEQTNAMTFYFETNRRQIFAIKEVFITIEYNFWISWSNNKQYIVFIDWKITKACKRTQLHFNYFFYLSTSHISPSHLVKYVTVFVCESSLTKENCISLPLTVILQFEAVFPSVLLFSLLEIEVDLKLM